MYPGFQITPEMTSAEFNAYVREMPRIKALRALSLADVLMLPHISNFNRKQWFESMAKVLRPRFNSNDMLTFNGRQVSFKQLKRSFNSIAGKLGASKVG